MKNVIASVMTALFLILWSACDKPATVETTAAPTDLPAEVAVSDAEIQRAADIHAVLHDGGIDDATRQERIAALLSAAGWTEERYRDLLFDISAHAASRESYLRAIE